MEHTRLRPGAIAEALHGWARFVRGPARELHAYEPEACSCAGCQWDDPVVRRAALRTALRALPAKAARELRALVQPLDECYLSRTCPGPDTDHIRDLLIVAPPRA